MPMPQDFSGDAVVPSRVRAFPDGAPAVERPDWVAVEAPLEVRADGKPVTVMMRTPGQDADLVRGFLFTEGIISAAGDVVSITPLPGAVGSQGGSVIDVVLAAAKARPVAERLFYSNSSCGVCGRKSIASLEVQGRVPGPGPALSRRLLSTLPGRLRTAQPAFEKTGGVHASALFTPEGELIASREDVGRHNALDKLVGWALEAGRIPLAGAVLLVSGRVSYEIVQKSIVAGIPVIAAVGAPSSLAVDLAERCGQTLVGFLRPGGMNVYAGAGRVTE